MPNVVAGPYVLPDRFEQNGQSLFPIAGGCPQHRLLETVHFGHHQTELVIPQTRPGDLLFQELGEDRAIPALERLATRELDGRVVRRCREVIARLREGRDKGEEVTKLREELDKLREEQRTLKDQMQKLQSRDGKKGKG